MKNDLLKKQLDKIEKMDSVTLTDYKQSIVKYSVDGEFKRKILKAIDEKLEKFDRSKILVESSDLGDAEGYE